MAITATFQADFSSFYDAVQRADVELRTFESGAGRAEKSLNRMVDTFSGRKVIQDATLMAEAITRVGGAAKLTADEQARANAVVSAGVEKFKALGQDVPPQLQRIADATKQINTNQSELTKTLTEVAGAFGVAFSIDAAVEFVRTLAHEAVELRNLSLQTRINIEDLQVLRAATAEYGVEGEQLGRALFQLQQRIAGGDESVARAYALMGISMDEVRQKGADAMQLFLLTERGLGSLSGALQDVAAKDLYGGRLGASLLAFSKDVDVAIAKGRDMNQATSESVKAVAEATTAIERHWIGIKNFFTELLAGTFVLADTAFGRLDSQITASLPPMKLAVAHGHELAVSHRQAAEAMDAEGQAAVFMATLSTNALKPLLGWQVKYLEQLKENGELNAQNAAALGVSVQQFDRYKEQIQQTTLAIEAQKLATEAWDRVNMDTFKRAIELAKQLDEYWKRATASTNELVQANLKAGEALAARQGRTVGGNSLDPVTQARTNYQNQLDTLHEQAAAHPGIDISAIEEQLFREFQDAFDKAATAGYAVADAHTAAAQSAGAMAQGATAAGQASISLVGAFQTAMQAFVGASFPSPQSLRDSTQEPGSMLGLGIPGIGPSGVSLSGLVSRPKYRAGGGPVSPGELYMVGERGPELFTPSSSGSIWPHGAGGSTVNVSVSGMLLSSDPRAKADLADAVNAAVMSALKRSGRKVGSV